MTAPGDPRFDRILEALVAFARHDFSVRVTVEGDDELDAIASGLNMLAEELTNDLASRRELEAAWAERRAAEASLVHAGRLAMLGQVAAGVGHEINNPITWVSLGLSIVGRELAALRELALSKPLDAATIAAQLAPIEATLDDVNEGIERIRVVANDLRTFARADDAIECVSIAEVVQTSVRLSVSAFASHATLQLDLKAAPEVAANRGRISQVAANLLVNAAQAVRDRGAPGVILISTTEQSGGALLSVEDNGPGVPDELRRRIFQPFFTTKGPEEGTGLGLALVRKIVEGYHGDIRVVPSSALGGARFEVWLPASAPPSTPGHTASPTPGDTARRLRILVVDDEPAMLRSMRALLFRDMNVEVSCGGLEAIERLKQDVGFDVVLCEMDMAAVNGMQLFEWVESHVPVLTRRLVLCSGGALDARARAFLADRGAPFLEKPISAEALERAIQRLGRR